jgi:hypothetical protein
MLGSLAYLLVLIGLVTLALAVIYLGFLGVRFLLREKKNPATRR